MAKRLTDNGKWNKIWFRKLSPTEKCFWTYLTDTCDHAGIWIVDWETAEHFIGTKISETEIAKTFSKQIQIIDGGNKWFVKDFIEFQYNCTIQDLNPLNKVHASIIFILKRHGIIEENKGLASPLQGDKDKDKDKDKEQRIMEYFEAKSYPAEEARSFFHHYESQGWVTGSGVPITNWRAKAENWHREQSSRNLEKPKGQPTCIILNT